MYYNKAYKIPLICIALIFLSPVVLGVERDASAQSVLNDDAGYEIVGRSVFSDNSDNENNELISRVEARIAALESSKQDLSVWMTIFVTSVILIIGLNIGLSVWQVGSIAQREAEDYMKEYEQKFENVINETIDQIDDKVRNYESNLNELVGKIKELEPKFESGIDRTEHTINTFASFVDDLLKGFTEEAHEAKLNIINEMEEWQEKKIKKIKPA